MIIIIKNGKSSNRQFYIVKIQPWQNFAQFRENSIKRYAMEYGRKHIFFLQIGFHVS